MRAALLVVAVLGAAALAVGFALRGDDGGSAPASDGGSASAREASSPPEPGPPEAGRVRFIRNATTPFEPFIADSTPAQRRWMRDAYEAMRGYAPSFDQALRWAPPTALYKDLYALYRGERQHETLIRRHPDWVLRDADGNRLYIPFGCEGGSCPQYAADVGNPEWRRHWIEAAREVIERGYAGLFIDDVNMELRVGDGSGEEVAPIDPRTGREMTEEDWRRYVAEFVEQVRTELPGAEITHNVIWFAADSDPTSDPSIERALRAADYIELERGFTDTGIDSAEGRFGLERFLDYIDWAHDHGRGIVLEPYGLDEARREYELAGYFLVSTGEDAIASDFEADPDNWWPGWETTRLGRPLGGRHADGGVLRRDFEHGLVLLNPPGEPRRRVELPGPHERLDGSRVTSVGLAGGEGAVLVARAGGGKR